MTKTVGGANVCAGQMFASCSFTNHSKDLLTHYVPGPMFGDGEILMNSKLEDPVYTEFRVGKWERQGMDKPTWTKMAACDKGGEGNEVCEVNHG